MKVFKLITIILCVMSMNRCKSQSKFNFDLSEEVLGKKISIITSINDVKFNKTPLSIGENYDCIESYSKQLLAFYNIDFEDTLVPDSNYGRNSVTFHFSKKDSIIGSYYLNTYTKESSKRLLELLQNKFGDSNFTHFRDKISKEKGEFDGKIWEDNVNNVTYFLNYKKRSMHDIETVEGWLTVVDNSNTIFLENASSGKFGYWSSYLSDRKRKGKENYTYQQFLIEKTEEGEEYYEKITQ